MVRAARSAVMDHTPHPPHSIFFSPMWGVGGNSLAKKYYAAGALCSQPLPWPPTVVSISRRNWARSRHRFGTPVASWLPLRTGAIELPGVSGRGAGDVSGRAEIRLTGSGVRVESEW